MIIGFDEFQIEGNTLKVELVNKIPDGYKLIDKQAGYEIYRKDEQIGGSLCQKRKSILITTMMTPFRC